MNYEEWSENLELPEPFDPRCERYAKDMEEIDTYVRDEDDEPRGPITPEERADWVRSEEGTYNPKNGHFLCDSCYIAEGMPSGGGSGWKCP